MLLSSSLEPRQVLADKAPNSDRYVNNAPPIMSAIQELYHSVAHKNIWIAHLISLQLERSILCIS